MSTSVKREGSRTRVEGVPEDRLGHLDDDWMMQLRGLRILLEHRGDSVSLEDIAALSGEAFNLCHSDHWEMRTYLSLTVDSLKEAADALGYSPRWLMGGQFHQMKGQGVEASRQQTGTILNAAWGEIDSGRPVLVAGVDGRCGDWFVASGYDRVHEQMYYIGGKDPQWAGISGLNIDTTGDPSVGKLGFWDSRVRGAIRAGFLGGWWSDVMFVLGKRTRVMSARDRTVRTLRLALRMFRPGEMAATPYFDVTYYFGEQAYEHWAMDLEGLDYPSVTTRPRPNTPEIYDLSCMIYQVQQIVRGRAAAAVFCEKAAAVLPVATDDLRAAASEYREEVVIAERTFAPFLSGDEAKWKAWLSDGKLRTAGVEAIQMMLGHERAAVGRIEEALKRCGDNASHSAAGIRIGNEPAVGEAYAASAGTGNVPGKADNFRITFDSAPGRDSFSLTMKAVARLLGIKADYAEILALSTNGFAPDVRPDEECRSDWMTRGRGQCLDLVAARLGIAVRPLGGFAPREYGKKHDPDAGRKAAAVIAGALAKGEVVITDSGWNESFSLWGIVTSAHPDGRIEGANPPAKANSLDHVCSFWALSRGGPELSQAEADRLMLARAVARIRGDREPFRPESLVLGLPATGAPAVPGAVVWGLPAMDVWIAQMGKPAYQQDNSGSSAGNARMCALYVGTGAKTTAAYLRHRMKSFPAIPRRHLESVAGRYERIAALLEPYMVWKKGKGYQAFMGELHEQNVHADKVLKPVKAELAAAADEIETALAATNRP